MKLRKLFFGFFMGLAFLMIAMAGGEPVTVSGDAAHIWIVLGILLVCVLSLLIVAWLSPEKKFYTRRGDK